MTFGPNERSKVVTLSTLPDTLDEADETFFLIVTNTTGINVADGQGLVTLSDDDASPTIGFSALQVSATDNNTGQTTGYEFPVVLSAASGRDVTVSYATADSFAHSRTDAAGIAAFGPTDFTAASGTLTIPAGQTAGTITVFVIGDDVYETNEPFQVNLSNPSGATFAPGGFQQSQGVIVNDDPPPAASIADVTVNEDGRNATFTVTLDRPSYQGPGFTYTTADGTAAARSDYTPPVGGSVGFTAYQTSATFTVPILEDAAVEGPETFTVTLATPIGATIARATATATIVDNDSPPAADVVDVSPDPRGTPVESMDVTFNRAVTGFDVSDLELTRDDGANLLTGSETLSSRDGGITWTLGGLSARTAAPDTYLLAVRDRETGIVDSANQSLAAGARDTWVVTPPPPAPPRAMAVFFGSGAWTPAFSGALQSSGLGEAGFGFAVPAGAGQADALPWGNLDKVSVRFDRPVLVVDLDLALHAVNAAGGTVPVTDFDYDEATNTATWTLAQAVGADRLVLDLDGDAGGVVSGDALRLDGEWADGTDSFPSGDGTAGGDFRFGVNVLAGDLNGSGAVGMSDWLQLQRMARLRRSAANPGTGALRYTPQQDLNGDGTIGTPDLLIVRRNLLQTLPPPAAAPAPALAPASASAGLRSALALAATRRELFGEQPVLG